MSLENLIARAIERQLAHRFAKRFGIVTSYDPKRHLAKVRLQPEDQETGWLPIRTSHIGNGWGMAIGLQIGDQVSVAAAEGDPNSLEIVGVVHSDKDAPPEVASGEMLLQHKDGAKIRFGNDKSVVLNDGDSGSINLDGAGNVTVASKSGKKIIIGQDGGISVGSSVTISPDGVVSIG